MAPTSPTAPIFDAASLWDLLDQRNSASSSDPFLYEGDDTVVTFGEFHQRVLRVAAGLAELGVGEGTPVVWQLPTAVDSIVASIALSRLGAVQTPIIHLYREREVTFCINQAQPKMVIVPGQFGGHDYTAMVQSIVGPNGPTIVATDQGLPEGDPATLGPAPTPGPGEEPIRWVYYTSGTTSDPKGVRHTDQTLMAAGMGLAKALTVSSNDVGAMVFPYAHIAGPDYLVMMISVAMPAMLMAAFVPDRAMELYKRWGCTLAGGSTVFYSMFLAEQRKTPDTAILPALRMLAGGGAPKPPEIFFEVKKEMGIPIAHGYGMTECPMIAQGGPNDSDEQLAYTDGKPVEGCIVTIITESGGVAAPGEEGEVRLQGPMVFKGYTDESLNAEAFDEAGRFRTGDLGVVRADGHVSLTGRLKDVIIRKGENISATEIEDILYTHPKVKAVAVVGLADPTRGERVCAVVETEPGQDPFSFDDLKQHCDAAGLMKQKTPEQLVIVDALPRNDTLQKVLKYKLREELADVAWP